MKVCLDEYKIVNNNDYTKYKYENFECFFRGFVYCSGKKNGVDSIKQLMEEYERTGKIHFENYYGAYHIVILNKLSKEIIFYGDNAGNCCFYFSKESKTISDSMLELKEALINITPNYKAIVQFINFNCIYSENTIANEIYRTMPNSFYSFKDNVINQIKKYEFHLERFNRYNNLNEYMSDLQYSIGDMSIYDVITGGTDSRTILAHLEYLKTNYELIISGSEDLVDVRIARKIAEKLKKKIYVSDESTTDLTNETINSLIKICDGVFGLAARYRLYKKMNLLKQMKNGIELGGVSGEFYKNSFLNQDFPFYKTGKVNLKKFYKLKLNPENVRNKIFTEELINYQKELEIEVMNFLLPINSREVPKYKLYFEMGVRIMQSRMITLTNSNNLQFPSIAPLAELDILRLAYREDPWNLEMNRWHRQEVSKYCPEISSIKTDRGLTLSNNKFMIVKELISNYIFLLKIALKRLLSIKKVRNIINDEPEIYSAIKKFSIYEEAIQKCRELSVIRKECKAEDIPPNVLDRLLTIGTFFK